MRVTGGAIPGKSVSRNVSVPPPGLFDVSPITSRGSCFQTLLNKKKAFRSGDREELRRVQHHLRDMLRECKDKRKLEPQHERGVVCNEGDHRMWGERQTV